MPTSTAAPGAIDERGQGLIEYALILSFIVIVLILIVTLLGHQTANLYSNISSGIGA